MAKIKLPIVQRQTYEYAIGWAHLDRWEDLAMARQTKPELVATSEDGDTEHRLLVVFSPQEWDKARALVRAYGPCYRGIEGAIGDSLASGCTHEHDCCGCVQQSAYATYLGKRKFSVRLYRTRNI